jgi:hypothetical protein
MLQPFDPLSLVLVAAFNPAVVVVAFLMGRSADQWQKILVAGFAGAIAGAVVVWFGTYLRLISAKGLGGEAGVFMASFALGLVWATAGYLTRQRS